MQLDLSGLPATDQDTGAPPATIVRQIDPDGKTACQYCARRFKRIDTHEKKCSENPVNAGAVAAEIESAGISIDALSLAISGTFAIIAAQTDEKWILATVESSALGAAWKPVFDAFMPSVVDSKWTLLGLALVQTYAVLAPRLKQEPEKEKFPQAI